MNEKNVNILIVEPGKAPRPASMANTLEAARKIVGGEIQVGCFLPQRVLLVSQEDYGDLTPNRCIPNRDDYIGGTFLLCGIPDEGYNFASLTPEQQKEFQDRFAKPDEFMLVGGKVFSNPDDVADMIYELWDTMRGSETVVLTKWGDVNERTSA